jgi:hypothetical protein
VSAQTDLLRTAARGVQGLSTSRDAGAMLHANPIICTSAMFDAAKAADDGADGAALDEAKARGFVVVSERPERAHRDLRTPTAYLNRAERRKRK